MSGMSQVSSLSQQSHVQDILREAPQRTTWQSFVSGLKTAGRVLAGIATLGISEAIIQSVLSGRGAKVSPRANDFTSLGMNRYLRREMSDFLNSPCCKPECTATANSAKQHLKIHISKELPFPEGMLASLDEAFIKDANRAQYTIDGQTIKDGSGVDVVKQMIQCCTHDNKLDTDALRVVTNVANQKIFASLVSGSFWAYGNKNPPIAMQQKGEGGDISYAVKAVRNSRGEKEYVIQAAIRMEGRDMSGEVVGTGHQLACLRVSKGTDGEWKVHIEDYQLNVKPKEGHTLPEVEGSAVGREYRDWIQGEMKRHQIKSQ